MHRIRKLNLFEKKWKRFAGLLVASWWVITCVACSNSGPKANSTTPTVHTEPTVISQLATNPLPSVTRLPTSLKTATPTPQPLKQPTRQTVLPTVPRSTSTSAPSATPAYSATLTIGTSSQGWPVQAYRYGFGPVRLALIGGIHGGYEWNTISLAYQFSDYFNRNPRAIPPEISLYIIPAANPDGQVKVIGHTGRFSPQEVGKDTISGRANAQGVDLNRNWDCGWQPDGYWRNQEVNAGEKPFSETETQSLSAFLTQPAVTAAVFWHSAVPAVYAGGCQERFAPADALAELYAKASGYPFELSFTSYPVTGSAVDWLASQGIPAIEVELTNHRDTDWEANLQAVTQIMAYYRQARQQQ